MINKNCYLMKLIHGRKNLLNKISIIYINIIEDYTKSKKNKLCSKHKSTILKT